jgi:hypothetical protein
MIERQKSFFAAFLISMSACSGGPGSDDTTSTSDGGTGEDEVTDGSETPDVDEDGGECSNCPDGTDCIEGMCVPLDCSDQGCPGLSYCDLATQTCQPGCALDSQCDNGSCDVATHSCVCDEGFADCGGECIPANEICDSVCGNGRIDPNEVCDGDALDGATCESLGFFSGTLTCMPDCSDYDTSACVSPGCGDGTIHEGEECDGANLDGSSCTDFGFDLGALACNPNCTFDTSGCDYTPQPEEGLFGECAEDPDCAPLTWCAYGSFCTTPCANDTWCEVEGLGGNVVPACVPQHPAFPDSGFCVLPCAGGLTCPGGMTCTPGGEFFDGIEICQ